MEKEAKMKIWNVKPTKNKIMEYKPSLEKEPHDQYYAM